MKPHDAHLSLLNFGRRTYYWVIRSKANNTKRFVFHRRKHFTASLEMEGQHTQALGYDRKPSFCFGIIGGEGNTTKVVMESCGRWMSARRGDKRIRDI